MPGARGPESGSFSPTPGTRNPEPVLALSPEGPDDDLQEAKIRENMWIEIIRHMERIYGDLANAQMQMERTTAQLRHAKEFADNIIRSMVNALIVTDRRGVIDLVNDATVALFGYEREGLLGRPLEVLFVESAAAGARPWASLWGRLLETESVHDEEVVARDRGGMDISVAVSGSVLHDAAGDGVGAVLVVRDLRETKRLLASAAAAAEAERVRARELARANEELRRLQDQLIQSEKMSSLGRLAAGVAHELNNPLGGMVMYAHLLLEDTSADDPRRANIQKIADLGLRCREIVQGLLGFARPPASGRDVLDVNAVLRTTMDVFAAQALFHNVAVEWQLAQDLPPVIGDVGQLQQAFSNIIVNAAQAMDGQGRLTLRTEPAPEGAGVRVSVQDTGPGIRAEDLPHLFEPFFTTKEAGQGTGLGLAIAYGIVQRHGGTITVTSRPGEGARFEMSFPATGTAPPNPVPWGPGTVAAPGER